MTKLQCLAHIDDYKSINITLMVTYFQVDIAIIISYNFLLYSYLKLMLVFYINGKQIFVPEKIICDAEVNYDRGDKISRMELD